MATIRIAPSLIAADFSRLSSQVREAEDAGADWLHLDVMDGHFVPNITFGPIIVEAVRRCTKLPLDTHLMIESPDKYIKEFRGAGSTRITVHQEACIHLHRTVHLIKEEGAAAGVAINPATPVAQLREILPEIDLVLIMSVNPGFGGQEFIPHSIEKIREMRELIRNVGREIHIEVDGGIDSSNAAAVVEAGADVLVAGTSIFGGGTIKAATDALRQAIQRPELKHEN